MPPAFELPGYAIYPGRIADTLPVWLATRQYSDIFILCDTHTKTHCLPRLPAFSETWASVDIPPGETQKTLATCEYIWQAMFDARLDRKALVINLGGGVIGDMGGFCAATYKRGVDFIQIPTTLLAMTDAAIGGKLGVDFRGIKNAVGVFRNPAAVFVDPAFLQTLPERELRSGFAEVIKHALIGNPELWEKIRGLPGKNPLTVSAMTAQEWLELLRASIAVKVRVVKEDPLEHGLRALLNFGHTIGHAIESYYLETEDPLAHGEAVAIGMLCEAVNPNAALEVDDRGVESVVFRHFRHRHLPETAFPALWELMLQDKKNASGAVRMAVPDAEPFSLRWIEPTRAEVEKRLLSYNGKTQGKS